MHFKPSYLLLLIIDYSSYYVVLRECFDIFDLHLVTWSVAPWILIIELISEDICDFYNNSIVLINLLIV